MFLKKKENIIWLLLSLFYAYQYVLRVIPAVSIDYITSKFALNPAQFGTFCGLYYIGYTTASIPLSIMLDKYNVKKVITCTILLVCLGIVPLLFDNWYLVLLGRIITSIGSAGAILSLFKIISTFFSAGESSKMLGISVTIGLIGGIYGGKPLALFMNIVGFKFIIITLVLIGLLIAMTTYVLLPNNLSNDSSIDVNFKSILHDILSILKNKTLILLAITGGLMVGPMEGFVDGWSVITFKVLHGWSESDATFVPSIIFIGMCIGASVIGIITDKTQKYYTIILSSACIMILAFCYILYGCNRLIMCIILFLIGFASAYQITIMSKVSLISDHKLITTGTAIANMIIMIFGSIYHSIISNTIMYSNGNSNDYSAISIQNGIYPLIIGLLLSIILLCLVYKTDTIVYKTDRKK